jgi:hypothetical protein
VCVCVHVRVCNACVYKVQWLPDKCVGDRNCTLQAYVRAYEIPRLLTAFSLYLFNLFSESQTFKHVSLALTKPLLLTSVTNLLFDVCGEIKEEEKE